MTIIMQLQSFIFIKRIPSNCIFQCSCEHKITEKLKLVYEMTGAKHTQKSACHGYHDDLTKSLQDSLAGAGESEGKMRQHFCIQREAATMNQAAERYMR